MTTLYRNYPFKVVDERSDEVVASSPTRHEAQSMADNFHSQTGYHYLVFEMKMCGGSKRLTDLVR